MTVLQSIPFGFVFFALTDFAFISHSRAADVAVQAAQVVRRSQATDVGTFADRMLILAPGGPIVLQTNAFIDGLTQHEVREKIVDDVLKQADTDRDGKSTWKEALDNPRFLYTGVFRRGSGNAQQQEQARMSLVRQFDVNSDGLVNRDEAQTVLNQFGGRGGAFGGGFRSAGGGTPGDLKPLLDADGDGKLSAAEIAAAPERLKSRDANDNDLLEAIEISPVPPQGASTPRGDQLYPALMPLGTSANFPAIHQALVSRYGVNGKLVAEGMPLFPRLLDALDRSANGQLDQDEVAGFNTMRPHVAITVAFKSASFVPAEHDASGVQVNFLAPEFQNRDAVNQLHDTVALSLPGVRLTIASPKSRDPQPQASFRATADGQLAMLDTDKNGYIEKKELESNPNAEFYMQQFDRWDEDGDGKVYAKEIEADFERQMAPQKAQINLSAQDNGTGLFAALDQSGDSRLGLREMRIAAERLKKLDADSDGMIANQELPTEIQVMIAQGGQSRGGTVVQSSPVDINGRRTGGMKWFTSMDRNGDGDVTLREFLGTPEKFRDLDTNADGFIEPAEAEKAK